MIRNETYSDGVCVAAEIIDLDAGTLAVEEYGVVTSTRALTADEIAQFAPTPADSLAPILDEINAATTVAKLRAAMVKVVEAMQ